LRNFVLALVATFALAVTTAAAFADDWTVTRLRGTVQQLVGGQWQPLARGDVVPDERSVFTRSNGYATLVRGNEAIELGPNTKIEIYDQGGRKPFTTILQHAGTLTVEAEVRNVQHFAVKTAYLAAVVKGTRFTVTARSSGGSVEVLRGQVSVENKQAGETVMVLAGQKAAVSRSGTMKVTGKPKAGTKAPAKANNGDPQKTSTGSNSNNGHGTTHDNGDTSGNGNNKPAKSEKSDDKPSKTSNTNTSNTSSGGGSVVETTTNTVANVIETTTDAVGTVVDTTTRTVDTVVDQTTDVVDKVGDTVDTVTNTTVVGTTVGTVTDTLDKTTKGLTGLLGKKPKGH
jgi:hypothetical protein